MDKRTFLKNSALISAGTLVGANLFACKQNQAKTEDVSRGFELPKLSYNYDALEPYIDAQTMELHHSMHHAGYTKKFNAALQTEQIIETDIHRIFENISEYSENIKNNGGGYFNHKLFWQILTPKSAGEPKGQLLSMVNSAFGSLENFKEKFFDEAVSVFGSGWTWLIEKQGKLEITSTSNQENPLMDTVKVQGTPLLAIDVWEHAYYLKYQNNRKEYINAFWNIVNWDQVSANLL